ncbi:DUF1062 domain-containing protein [uncultured Roseibium sp.]|uniref:DUF1062 domain-containing protein n=1 Tax=uncultured Roseibium sp. TaxID=1936171 RepID=UPI003443F5FC
MASETEIEWTIRGSQNYEINRHCSRCSTERPFASSHKFRLNANGSRLDAWLIYRCQICGKRWNCSVFERRSVSSLGQRDLQALQSNDPEYAVQQARVISAVSKSKLGKATCCFQLERRPVLVSDTTSSRLRLVILNPELLRVRLDAVLARGLCLSRKQIVKHAASGTLRIRGTGANTPKGLKKPVARDVVIEIESEAELQLSSLFDP